MRGQAFRCYLRPEGEGYPLQSFTLPYPVFSCRRTGLLVNTCLPSYPKHRIPLSKQNKNIFLIGMPGVGKSYWAGQIAAAFNLDCIDLDDMIEVRTGHTISVFFERFGETSFRELEQQTLAQIIQVFPANAVIACGGGTPCFYDNLQQMKRNGTVIYLQADLEQLYHNLDTEIEQRPLLKESGWKVNLAVMLEQRKSVYERADETVSVSGLTLEAWSRLILLKSNQ
jgi:shikimate kinase